MAFEMPRIATMETDQEKAAAIDAALIEAHAEIAELIAAQTLNDAMEADAVARATRNPRR